LYVVLHATWEWLSEAQLNDIQKFCSHIRRKERERERERRKEGRKEGMSEPHFCYECEFLGEVHDHNPQQQIVTFTRALLWKFRVTEC